MTPEAPDVVHASVVYVTCDTRETALRIARQLVEERLVACGNLLDHVTSVYRWDDAIQEESEVVLLLKTRAALVAAVIERAVALHPYDCPCVTSWPITAGHGEYLGWIAEATS